MPWSWLAAVLDVLSPESCARCGAPRGTIPWFAAPAPRVPGLRPWDAPHLCGPCFDDLGGRLHVGGVEAWPLLSPLVTSARLVEVVGRWKYRGLRGLGWPLANVLRPVLEAGCARHGGAVLVPVPLHRRRRRERGFDHVVQLGALAVASGGPPLAADVVTRRRATRQQASCPAAGDARRRNVAGAFACAEPPAGGAREVILLDDIATTGATLNAVARALTAAGWRVGWCLALAQAGRLEVPAAGLDSVPQPGQVVARMIDLDPAGRPHRPAPSPGGAMKKARLAQLDPTDRRVLMRVDFNVPLDQNGAVGDDTRIRAALPSIEHVVHGGGSVVLMSHLGRPKGEPKPEFSLRPVADRLAELVDVPVRFASDTVGDDAHARAEALGPGEVLVLENVRFHPGETKNDPELSRALAALGDVYVNDAFGTAHRAHASTVGAAEHFETRYAGFLMEKELDYLGGLLESPRRPFAAILGGAKVDSKVEVIRNLLDRVDHLLLGGGMVFTFFRVMGLNIGDSLLDEPSLDAAAEILEQAKASRAELVLPTDVVVSTDFSDAGEIKTVLATDIPDGWQGLDIGEDTVATFRETIAGAQAIFWNGPMGVFEIERFARGTRAVGEAVVEATRNGAESVVGGGDSVAALNQLGLIDGVSHASTGGGASLEFMAGRDLPGVAALSDA